MSGNLVEKISHDCGTSDALQVWEEEGKYNGYCFACGTYISDPYHDKPEGYEPAYTPTSDEERQARMEEITACPSRELPPRGLSTTSMGYFGVRVGTSEQDGATPEAVYFPYRKGGSIEGYKVRLVDHKKMWAVGTIRDCDMFGWREALAAGAKTLFITEGEYDAIALYQAIKEKDRGTKYSDFNPAVVSLRNGAGSVKKELTAALPEIRRNFKDVVLVFDEDDVGREAVRQAVEVLPTARTAGTLPAKDANACVLEGRSKGLVAAALWNSSAPKNSRFVDVAALFQAGRVQVSRGLDWPWQGITDLTRGMRFGETYYFGSGTKMGKTTLVYAIAAHLIKHHDLHAFLAQPESTPADISRRLLGQIAGKIFHDPNVEMDYEAYDKAAEVVGDKLSVLDVYQYLGWDHLRGDLMAAHNSGARAVLIDPITNLTNGVPPSESNTKLQEISQDLAAISKDLQIMIFIFCHLKSPTIGPPHERGGSVMSSQFAGSRAMMRSCHTMFGLQGDKDPNLDKYDRNMRKLVILEDRVFGASGSVDLFYDDQTGLYNEVKK